MPTVNSHSHVMHDSTAKCKLSWACFAMAAQLHFAAAKYQFHTILYTNTKWQYGFISPITWKLSKERQPWPRLDNILQVYTCRLSQKQRNCGHIQLRLVMTILWNRAGHYIFILWFLLCSSFFLHLFCLAWSQPSYIGCLPYFRTWCGVSANLGCRSETCCT